MDQVDSLIEKAIKKIKNGMSIAVFPEGTRSKDGNLLPFKKGAFFIAKLSRMPIIPILINKAYQVAPKGKFLLHPAKHIEVKFYKAIDGRSKSIDMLVKNKLESELISGAQVE